MDLQTLRHALGGEIVGRQLICPGPGHSHKDRSLSITLSRSSPIGFLCHSFAGDDWRDCQEYVCGRLGLKPWSPDDGTERVAVSTSTVSNVRFKKSPASSPQRAAGGSRAQRRFGTRASTRAGPWLRNTCAKHACSIYRSLSRAMSCAFMRAFHGATRTPVRRSSCQD